eukprot:6930617-Prymnesium_polylepis.1
MPNVQDADACVSEAVCRPTKIAYFPDPAKVESEPGYPPPAVRDLLASQSDLDFETVTVAEILAGCLEARAFTVLCVPGGFAPNYDVRLGAAGLELIRQFVSGGGGFVG